MDDNRRNAVTRDSDTIEWRVFFGDLWRGAVKFWWVAAILALLIGGYQFYKSYVRYSPMYSVSATYTVHTENSILSGENGMDAYSFYYDRNTADQLAEVLPTVINSNLVRQKVCAELGLPYMPASVSASCVIGSNMVTLTAVGPDAELTYKTLVAVSNNYSAVADYILGRTRLVTISDPEIPTAPYNKLVWRTQTLKGAALGLFLGLTWIVIYAIMRKTVRTKDDIRTRLNHNCLGILPQVTFKRYRSRINTDILITNPRIGSDFLESVRLLRSSVQTAVDSHGKSVMLTSTAPGEGKSVTALNLAAMFAKDRSRVLVIDCDMRNSGVCAMTGISPEFSETDTADYAVTAVPSLRIEVLTFNTQRVSPRRILHETYIQPLLEKLKESYDYIFIDTPPCGIISDALSIARAADSVVYVIRQDTVLQNSIRQGLSGLINTEANVIGCVLNGASGGPGGYGSDYSYRGYNKYYRSGYYGGKSAPEKNGK